MPPLFLRRRRPPNIVLNRKRAQSRLSALKTVLYLYSNIKFYFLPPFNKQNNGKQIFFKVIPIKVPINIVKKAANKN